MSRFSVYGQREFSPTNRAINGARDSPQKSANSKRKQLAFTVAEITRNIVQRNYVSRLPTLCFFSFFFLFSCIVLYRFSLCFAFVLFLFSFRYLSFFFVARHVVPLMRTFSDSLRLFEIPIAISRITVIFCFYRELPEKRRRNYFFPRVSHYFAVFWLFSGQIIYFNFNVVQNYCDFQFTRLRVVEIIKVGTLNKFVFILIVFGTDYLL